METHPWRQVSSIPCASYWTSYKGWKPAAKSSTWSIHTRVIELPIRDGNIVRKGYHVVKASVIELPIRDGNMISCYRGLAPISSYWTSYKGWKQDGGHVIYATTDVIELPIRDGNSQASPLTWPAPLCYWTSYKGWKLKYLRFPYLAACQLLNFL